MVNIMVNIEEAQQMILRHITPLPTEELPLLQGLGRVASEDVIAPRDIPATDKSAMDGYAFSFAPFQGNCLFVYGNIPGHMSVVLIIAGFKLLFVQVSQHGIFAFRRE